MSNTNTKNLQTFFVSVLIVTLLVIIFGFTRIAHAVPAAPSPTCEINATVLGVQKVKTDPEQPPGQNFYFYAVKLKIHSSSVYQQEGYGSCDKLINLEQDPILHLSEYDKTPIKVEQDINAKIKFGGDEWFHGYFLSDIKILTNTTEKPTLPPNEPDKTVKIKNSSEISAILVEQKLVTSVESIKLDNQRYNVTGYRAARLFWLFPVKLELKFIVDAKTGNVESVSKPWWSFLAC
ncbi:hypothetical protein KKD57_03165 [Patescibacteria group bacterium]|nr:hypothetical protein [Patescibacteria group bacterium]